MKCAHFTCQWLKSCRRLADVTAERDAAVARAMRAERERAEAIEQGDRDARRADAAHVVTAERDALRAEVEAMQPVVDAADRVYVTCEPTIPLVMAELGQALDALRTRKGSP